VVELKILRPHRPHRPDSSFSVVFSAAYLFFLGGHSQAVILGYMAGTLASKPAWRLLQLLEDRTLPKPSREMPRVIAAIARVYRGRLIWRQFSSEHAQIGTLQPRLTSSHESVSNVFLKIPMRGRALDISEAGIAGVFATEWEVGTPVRLEFSVPVTRSPVRVGGVLRSHSGCRYGFEFVDLSPDQREVISKTCRTLALLQ